MFGMTLLYYFWGCKYNYVNEWKNRYNYALG